MCEYSIQVLQTDKSALEEGEIHSQIEPSADTL